MMTCKALKSFLSIGLISIIFVGCGSALSNLETQNKNNPGKQQKPQCPIDNIDNCWARSVRLISQCLPPSLVGELTADRRFCHNSEGLIVNFSNPYDLNPKSDQIAFDVYNVDRKCFRVEKRGDNILITDSPYGMIRLDMLDSNTGAMSISCLFGETLQINSKTLNENCSSQKLKKFNDWPEGVFTSSEEKSTRDFMFSFVGLGLGHAPVFQCKERR